MHGYNSKNNYCLFDFTTSVYVVYDKDRSTNFRKATRGSELLYGTDSIAIESWKKIFLPLKIEAQISILILKKDIYISNFPFNPISFICLEDKGYK